MSTLPFAKAHGLGNDFVLVEQAEAERVASEWGAWARRLCDRHQGVGADGVLLWQVDGRQHARMRLLNADGGEAEISANGLRCLSAFLYASGRVAAAHSVRTAAGDRAVEVSALPLEPGQPRRLRVRSDLGAPILDSVSIPVALDPPRSPVLRVALPVEGRAWQVTATSLGNPHCAVFLDTPADDALLQSLGPRLEQHPLFPRRTNVEFVTVEAPDRLRVRFWERGVGHTQASGTGAASALVAAVLNGRAARRAQVVCDGGTLEVEWPAGGSVRQVGEVELLFSGFWPGP